MTATFLNEDAYYRVLKAFAAGRYDLKKEMLLAKLRRELVISDQRHELLRAMIEEGRELKERDCALLPPLASAQPQATKGYNNGRLRQKAPGLSTPSSEEEDFVRSGHAAMPPQSPFNNNFQDGQFPRQNGFETSRPNKRLRKDSDGHTIKQDAGDINELIGFKIRRWWPENGGWFEGAITDYRPETGEHCIVYDMNTPSESYEWFDLSISRHDEFQLTSQRINIIEHAPRGQALRASARTRPPDRRDIERTNGAKVTPARPFAVERIGSSSSEDSLSD